MHGTGTIAGDTTESQSVAACFGESHTGSEQLFLGTVKPNLGHGEAVSGVTSIIKALMMLFDTKAHWHQNWYKREPGYSLFGEHPDSHEYSTFYDSQRRL